MSNVAVAEAAKEFHSAQSEEMDNLVVAGGGRKPLEQDIGEDPDAARYMFMPVIQKIGLNAQHMQVTHIDANSIVMLQTFRYPTTLNNGKLGLKERSAYVQGQDFLRLGAQHGATELAGLRGQPAEIVRRVLRAVVPTETCSRYPVLKHLCSTCWRDHLAQTAPLIIADMPEELQETASATAAELDKSLETGLNVSRSIFDQSTQQIQNNKKFGYSNQDRINMMHNHLSEPDFAGGTTGLAREVASIVAEASKTPAAVMPDVDEMIAAKVAELMEPVINQRDDRIEELEKQLEVAQNAQPTGGMGYKEEPREEPVVESVEETVEEDDED